ncbi:hypothetical protein [Streptomyces sp. NPDC001515]
MEAVILILGLLFVAFLALGVFVTVKVVGAAKRGVDRTIDQARRTVEDTALKAKSYGQAGVGGELAQLRLSLRTSMRATQDALRAGVAEDPSLKESLGLFERLGVHGHELENDLKRLEREPDKATVAARLPDLKERTTRITRAAESLRWAARDRARQFADDDLAALNEQIDIEAGALRHWTREEPVAGPGVAAGAGSAQAAAAGASAGAGAEPGARGGRAEAITAGETLRGMEYPWRKTARPETTN